MQDGKLPIMCAAVDGHRELVEILLPKTRPIPYVPDWSVDGIIKTMKYLHFGAQVSTRCLIQPNMSHTTQQVDCIQIPQ
jgi:hypothetical protein